MAGHISVIKFCPVAASHSLIFPSKLAETSVLPSGENAMMSLSIA
jgi:hypothetical protein